MRPAPVAALLMLAAAPAVAAPAPDARARLEALNAREAALAARIDGNRETLVRLLSALETLRRDPPPALLARPERARDAARAAILLKAATPELQARARRFAAEAAELKRVRRAAAEAGAELFAAESAQADVGAPPPLSPPPPRHGDFASPPSAAPAPTVKGAPPRLVAPVGGEPSRRFGEVRPGRPRSEGWGWTPAAGAPVSAPAAGEVEFAGPVRGQALVAVLRTGPGWLVVVSGLGRITASTGAVVRAGDRLGEAAPGPAGVGLQLRRGAEAVDPGPQLSAR